jgi:uncharacterized oligopeptide transporter (OPT) family protein
VGASYPYVVLKIGYGPNISVVSAFFGYIALSVVGLFTGVKGTRWENNLVQTAGTAAGQAGFMCVVLAAIDMLNQRPELHFHLEITPLQTFLWLTTAGMLGVLLAVPLRRHYIEVENLRFADGTAAGETLIVLDMDRREAGTRVRALGAGLGLSGIVAFLRDGPPRLIAPTFPIGPNGAALHFGFESSLLGFGSGLLIGPRIALSMGLGTVLSWIVAPPILTSQGIVAHAAYQEVLRWVMWPATGLMVSGGIAALALRWRLIVGTFRSLSTHDLSGEEFPLRWVAIGATVLSVALCLVQRIFLGFPIWLSLASLLLSVPLMLVGIRVLGETNWAPISALANLMQAVFAALAPGSMAMNMIGSGMSGSVAANGEHLMQDFRAGQIVGANPRHLTTVQLLAVPVGSAAVAFAYPALRQVYGIGGSGLSSPISVKWAGFAELLSRGFSALPHGSLTALVVGLALGVALTLLEPRGPAVPSPTAVGLGMLIPGYAVLPIAVGGVCQWIWARRRPQSEASYGTPLASGFIAGEALVVLVVSIVAVFGH